MKLLDSKFEFQSRSHIEKNAGELREEIKKIIVVQLQSTDGTTNSRKISFSV